eukprot:Ihof_evm1s67 gene=Ihof_evmTU1s67
MVTRDQMVGKWQVPVADVAVTTAGYDYEYRGEAMAIGEKPPLAIFSPASSARMAIGEAITNICAASIKRLSDIRLSANWMAACGKEGQDAALYEAVQAIGVTLCPQLELAIPVGKDSLSMWSKFRVGDTTQEVISPVSLIATAFSPVLDVRTTLTPELQLDTGDTVLILLDPSGGKTRTACSSLAQTFNTMSGLDGNVPDMDDPASFISLFNNVQALLKDGTLLAYHDRSDGGLIVCVLEMCFASHCGVTLTLPSNHHPLPFLFAEELGVVIQVYAHNASNVLATFRSNNVAASVIGQPNTSRAQILKELDSTAIIPHAAAHDNQRFHIEELFWSFNHCVLDNCCHEYIFLVEFFQAKTKTVQDIFKAVFSNALGLFKTQFEATIMNSYDTIGVLLCIRIVRHFQKITQERRIPVLDKYHVSLEMMLWPRVKMLLVMNIDSIKRCALDPRRVGNIETRPHYVTRRYAEFAASIATINEGWNDPQIASTTARMCLEFEGFLSAMASLFQNPKDQMIFFINNYDLVLSVFGGQETLECPENEHFEKQLNIRIQEYVEEELCPYLGDMEAFVKQYETVMGDCKPEEITYSAAHIETIVRSFASDWRRAIDCINSDVLQSFTNFRVGTDILQAVLTGLVMYYQ